MAKLSAITTPSLTFDEGAAPSTPASGDVILYAKTDGLLYSKDDAGAETLVSGGAGGGAVATDAIWDAAGDLAVGSGANTAARLAIGNAGAALSRINGAVAWNAGTAFPTAATGDRYFRTDRGREYYYDGTRWLTVQEFGATLSVLDALFPILTTANNSYAAIDQGENGAYATRAVLNTTSISNDGSNYHTVQIKSKVAAGTTTNLGSSFTTAADTASQAINHTVTINAVVGATDTQYLVTYTRTGSNASIYVAGTLFYRLIG